MTLVAWQVSLVGVGGELLIQLVTLVGGAADSLVGKESTVVGGAALGLLIVGGAADSAAGDTCGWGC